MTSSLNRVVVFAVIFLAAACSSETYTCCVDGLIETCECPSDANCLTPQILDNGDGTCQMADTGDGAAG